MSKMQEDFALAAAKLIIKANDLGYTVTLGEAWRTPEQAQWDADHGKGIVHSLHMERLAIDIILFKDGVWLKGAEGYTQLGAWWKSLGLLYRWGGDFHSKDYDHFSITPDGVRA